MGLLKQAGRSCGQVTVSGKMLWHWSRIPFAFLLVVLLGISTLAEAQSYRFSRVEVQGNQRIQSGTIANYIGIPSGSSSVFDKSYGNPFDTSQSISPIDLAQDSSVLLDLRKTALPVLEIIVLLQQIG